MRMKSETERYERGKKSAAEQQAIFVWCEWKTYAGWLRLKKRGEDF